MYICWILKKSKCIKMSNKNEQLILGADARQGLKRGVDQLADIVKQTLGPKGKNVMILKNNIPQIINDGVSIAKTIRLWDPLEHAGATMVKNVSKDTDTLYGDGTTTATILAQAILNAGMELDNVNYYKLKKAFDFYVTEVEKYLIKKSKKIIYNQDLRNLALVSTNGDTEIVDLLVQAYKELGFDAYLTVKESPEKTTYLKSVKGLKYDSGWVSPYLTNDKTDRTAKYSHPDGCHVCYVSGELVNEIDIIPILEIQAQDRLPLLIIAERIYGEALAVLVQNKLQGNMAVSAVVVPGLKHEHADIMADMICVTGGEVLNTEDGRKVYDNIDKTIFGIVQGFEVGNDYFTLSKDNREEEKVKERISHIEEEMKKFQHELFQKSAKARIAKLTSGVGVIYIGGNSEIEINEKKLRAQDAVNALACGIDKGYLPGGGIGLMRAAEYLESNSFNIESSVESKQALHILIDAMRKPYEQILINCGMIEAPSEPDWLERISVKLFGPRYKFHISKIIENPEFGYGYNGATEQYSDLLADGIVDALSVTVGALRNAVSVSSIILSTGAAVLDGEVQNKNEQIMFNRM